MRGSGVGVGRGADGGADGGASVGGGDCGRGRGRAAGCAPPAWPASPVARHQESRQFFSDARIYRIVELGSQFVVLDAEERGPDTDEHMVVGRMQPSAHEAAAKGDRLVAEMGKRHPGKVALDAAAQHPLTGVGQRAQALPSLVNILRSALGGGEGDKGPSALRSANTSAKLSSSRKAGIVTSHSRRVSGCGTARI